MRTFALVASLFGVAQAATRTYDFEVGWLTANPDGAFDRPTIGINGQWPIPAITADVGDRVIVNVLNSLGNQTTSLHFHGLYMNGTSHMDGAVGATQCDIQPGAKFTYDFNIDQPGTYWYHSHVMGQYPDGLRGPLIINDPATPFKGMYDEEIVLSVSDWYHDQFSALIPPFISKYNPTGAEPVPNAALLNDTVDLRVPLKPGKTYLFRVINIGAFASQYLWFEGHNITIVEVDGIYTQPAVAEMIYVTPAQRYSFLLTAKNGTNTNYPFMASMDTDLFDSIPDGLDWNVTGWLTYDDTKPFPDAALIDEFDFYDDYTLVPYDNMTLLGEPDHTIELEVIMDNLGDGANYAFFNNITYKAPKVPTLYTALSSGEVAATNVEIYGSHTHSFILQKGEIVQINLDNSDTGKHPFHLHGHAFQAVYRSEDNAGYFADSNVTEADFPAIPMRRDTFRVNPGGNVVLRFRADNPGVWLFHCHIEWHVASGLTATMIAAPLSLQQDLKIPADHYAACAAAPSPTPTVGNAAGNTGANILDLTGEPSPPAPLPAGFTSRGIVALVFSCLSGIIGTAIVAWYGLSGLHTEGGVGVPIGGEGDKGVVGGQTATPAPAAAAAAAAAPEQEVMASSSGGSAVRT